jgi:hypothetical protein
MNTQVDEAEQYAEQIVKAFALPIDKDDFKRMLRAAYNSGKTAGLMVGLNEFDKCILELTRPVPLVLPRSL